MYITDNDSLFLTTSKLIFNPFIYKKEEVIYKLQFLITGNQLRHYFRTNLFLFFIYQKRALSHWNYVKYIIVLKCVFVFLKVILTTTIDPMGSPFQSSFSTNNNFFVTLSHCTVTKTLWLLYIFPPFNIEQLWVNLFVGEKSVTFNIN